MAMFTYNKIRIIAIKLNVFGGIILHQSVIGGDFVQRSFYSSECDDD